MIRLGEGPLADFGEPLAMLSDCHRRIERFLDGLLAVAAAGGGELDLPQREALDTALRYFDGMGAKHNADEEDSLFPRLRSAIDTASDAAGETVLEGLARLESEHEAAASAHAAVGELGRRWLTDGRLPAADAERLMALLTELREVYREHIRFEDEVVFPYAAGLLAVEQLAEVGQEMAARRGSLTCSQRKALGRG